jgi:hypothetical protein
MKEIMNLQKKVDANNSRLEESNMSLKKRHDEMISNIEGLPLIAETQGDQGLKGAMDNIKKQNNQYVEALGIHWAEMERVARSNGQLRRHMRRFEQISG